MIGVGSHYGAYRSKLVVVVVVVYARKEGAYLGRGVSVAAPAAASVEALAPCGDKIMRFRDDDYFPPYYCDQPGKQVQETFKTFG